MTSEDDKADLPTAYATDPVLKEVFKFGLVGELTTKHTLECITKHRSRDTNLHDHYDIPCKRNMGVRKTTKDIVSRYCWKAMRHGIKNYMHICAFF